MHARSAFVLVISLGSACGDKAPTPVAPTPSQPAPPASPPIEQPPPAPPAKPAPQPIELAKDQPGPTKIVVTATDIVWIDEGNGDETGGKIMKLPKAGGPAIELAKDQAVPLDLAVDDKRVYWTTRGPSGSMTDVKPTGGVWSVPIGGGKVTALAVKRAAPGAIALDATSVYFGEQGLVEGKGSAIVKVGKSGPPLALIHKDNHPGGIATDADHVYWSTGGTCISENGAPMPADGSINARPLAGGATTTLAGGLRCPEDIAVADDGIYFANMEEGTIVRVPKTGGTPVVLIKEAVRSPRYVAVDATTVYWAGGGYVKRRLRSGGAIETLWTPKNPVGLAVDDAFVYVTDSSAGIVVKIAK